MRYYEDIHTGDKFISRARTVTEADIVFYAMFSGDWMSGHVDAELSARGPFGQRIAHGWVSLAMADGFFSSFDIALTDVVSLSEVRFTAPVYIGDTIHLESEVIESKGRRNDGVLSFLWNIVNQNGAAVTVAKYKICAAKKPAPIKKAEGK